jgi:RNA recognition motif-containing protein
VYVIGIPKEIATEEILSRWEYFRQYGEIKKIVVNNSTVHASAFQRPTVSAYVTFVNEADAWECLFALEDFSINGHPVKASFGTSKYCASFLSGQACTKPDCMYLHHQGDPDDSFSTEEIQNNSAKFVEMTRPCRPDDYDDWPLASSPPTIFPPRRYFSDEEEPPPAPVVEEYAEPPAAVVEEREQHFRNSFLDNLLAGKALMSKPLVVDYATTLSLDEQFSLSAPSIRAVLSPAGCHSHS